MGWYMIPKRIELENFLSFGRPAVELVFTDDEPLWVLCGRNGSGKSAVFDGITYALYGKHRGGSLKAEQLIRHGAKGFRIVFEFEFAGNDYRITRVRSGRPTQKLERHTNGDWAAVIGINSAPEIEQWVEKTLGLTYEAFTSSVLLRQGEADKLFSSSRDERIAVLKGIIGFEQFEEVSERVHTATANRKTTLANLRTQLGTLAAVTPEELADAESVLLDAEQKRQDAQVGLAAAAQQIEQAKQFSRLAAQQAQLQQQLRDADLRARDAEKIRADKLRLDDLNLALPVLESLDRLRGQIAGLEPKLSAAEADRNQTLVALETATKSCEQAKQNADRFRVQVAETDHKAKMLHEEVERGTKFLELADAIEQLKSKLASFPADLAQQLKLAETDEQTAGEACQEIASKLAAAEALLRQTRSQQKRFADVKIGVTCSMCGQLVDEEHAKKERDRLVNEAKNQQGKFDRLRTEGTDAESKHKLAIQQRTVLQTNKSAYDGYALQMQVKRASLTQFGGVADARELRAKIATQLANQALLAQQAADLRNQQTSAMQETDRLETERKNFAGKLKTSEAASNKMNTELVGLRAQHDAKRDQLSPQWQARFAEVDAAILNQLAQERDRLHRSRVSAQFDLLSQDDAKRAEWTKQLEQVQSDMDLIPDDVRITEKEAKQRQEQAQTASVAANAARDTAVRLRDKLKSQAEESQRLTAQVRAAEREHDLHKKLDDLLGQNGLQRELVRDAENQIVSLANETLLNLSDGELSLEQEDGTGRDDKAFALRVWRAGDILPIGVLFLSGSQKFRVAVSVALAIGRFASGRARPLEAVIIDEGFGSLDKDGLRAMVDELKRVQQAQDLKRIILVSHQEEFTSQFPVGYRLQADTDGTVAEPFRH
jgi:DNA repair protein SbcC/Rad50